MGYFSLTSSIYRADRSADLLLKDRAPWRPHVSVISTQRAMLVLLLIVFEVATAGAMPLAEYLARTRKAAEELERAAEIIGPGSLSSDSDRVTSIMKTVRDTLPRVETVEWDGARVRVNNEWLQDELSTFQGLPFGDPRREEILQRSIDRLRALDERLTEVDSGGGPVASSSKYEDKARLEEISRREEFKPKPPQENIFQRAWKRFKEWLNGLFPASGGLEPGSMSWLSLIAMIVIFGLAAAVLGYAISKLIPFFQRRMGKPRDRREARIVLGERLAPDQTASDLLSEAETLARRGELRAAIRKAYIALLCELGDRKILTLAQHKTNRDYLRAVREKRPLLDEMQKLTSSFENHWYGSKQTSTDDWTAFRAGYTRILNVKF